MEQDIEIIEDTSKEINFNFKSYFTLTIIMIIISFIQMIFCFMKLATEYMDNIMIFKCNNNIYLTGNIVILILGIIIITNLIQKPKLSGLSGIIIGLISFITYPVITQIIGLLLFIEGIRLIKNS